MTVLSIGDLSQHYQSLRFTGQTKDRLQTLSAELSTGKQSDLAAALDGNVGPLISIKREIALLGDYRLAAKEVSQTLTLMQNALDSVEALRSRQSAQSLSISQDTSKPTLEAAARASVDTFEEMVASLNRKIGDRSLFSGTQTDVQTFAEGGAMLSDLLASLGGATSANDVIAAVEFWFDDPAGGFSVMGYQGDTGAPPEKPVSATQSVSLVATGQSSGIKQMLKAAAIGAIAGHAGSGLTDETKAALVQRSGIELVSASASFNAMRAEMGDSEAFVAQKTVEHEAQLTTLKQMYNDITVADPYETAVRLQEVQQQLETQFAITARLSGLSLVNYL